MPALLKTVPVPVADAPVRRPRNAAATRAAILEAAREHFAKGGYDQVSVRAIAAGAGIDAALVIRYFGSKERLFIAVLESCALSREDAMPEPPEEFGVRLCRFVLGMTGDPSDRQLQALDMAIRSTTSPQAHGLVREDIERRVFAPLVARFGGGHDAEIRARVVVSFVMGISVMRGLLGRDMQTESEIEDMTAYVAPLLQSLSQPRD
jgi:AcrR family transcriptional regulator